MDALGWYAIAGLISLGHWFFAAAYIGVDDDELGWLALGISISFFVWPLYWYCAWQVYRKYPARPLSFTKISAFLRYFSRRITPVRS